MPAPVSHIERERTHFVPRQRDRRSGLGHILAILSRSIGDSSDLAPLRGAFEETTRRIVPVRAVRLRDANARWIDRAGPIDAVESVVLPVAGGTLEAFFDPGAAWRLDFQAPHSSGRAVLRSGAIDFSSRSVGSRTSAKEPRP